MLDLDLRSLAATRILLGLTLLLDCCIRWSDATMHYTDLGVLPRRTLLDMGWQPNFFSLQMINGQPPFIHLLFLFQALAALALVLGFHTRIAALLSWLLLVSIHNRNPWLLNGGDVYARVILFWLLFLPWGQFWSMDARVGRRATCWGVGRIDPEGKTVRSLAGLALLLQVSLVYWFAALPKSDPSWVGDYSAINISLHLDHLVRPLGRLFRDTFSGSLAPMTWAVLAWETWGPFLLWFPFDRGQVRTVALFGFMAMHLGFEMTMQLGLFPTYCAVILVVLLPSWFWDGPLRKLTTRLEARLGRRPDSDHVPEPSRFRRRLTECLCGFLLIYTLCWNFRNEQFRPHLGLPHSWDWIGYTLRLDQRWNMFSPSPPYQDGWWVIQGIRRSGQEFDMRDPSQEVSWDKPNDIAGSYRNQRRRRWMMELRSTDSKLLMESTCRYLCWRLNGTERSLSEVVRVRLYYVLEMTWRDGTEAKPEKYLLFDHDNFPLRSAKSETTRPGTDGTSR